MLIKNTNYMQKSKLIEFRVTFLQAFQKCLLLIVQYTIKGCNLFCNFFLALEIFQEKTLTPFSVALGLRKYFCHLSMMSPYGAMSSCVQDHADQQGLWAKLVSTAVGLASCGWQVEWVNQLKGFFWQEETRTQVGPVKELLHLRQAIRRGPRVAREMSWPHP